MVSRATRIPAEDEGPGPGSSDPLRRAVHLALAIYLLPVVAVVCVIGAASIAVGWSARSASRLAIAAGLRPGGPARRPLTPPHARRRRRQRAGR